MIIVLTAVKKFIIEWKARIKGKENIEGTGDTPSDALWNQIQTYPWEFSAINDGLKIEYSDDEYTQKMKNNKRG